MPDRVVVHALGVRAWAYVMRIEPGLLWLVPGERLPVGRGDPLRLTFPADGPGIGMAGHARWVGSDALSVAVEHPCDVECTHAWAQGRAAVLPNRVPRVA